MGSAMASIGQVDVFNVLKNSPVLQSIPSLRNLSGPLTANDLLQKLMEVARKASPSETASILKSLQQMKPPPGASAAVAKITSTAAVATTTTVATPSTKSTIASSKATTLTNKDKGTSDRSGASLASNTVKKTTPIASLIQKTVPIISSPSDAPMDIDISKGPTTVASTPAKSTIGLVSPTKSVGSKSPMSVAVEIPKVKLSGAAIAAAMVPAVKSNFTAESNASATTSNSSTAVAGKSGTGALEGESAGGHVGVKTRQKQVKPI